MKIIKGSREQLLDAARNTLYSFAMTGDEETRKRLLELDHRLGRRGRLNVIAMAPTKPNSQTPSDR